MRIGIYNRWLRTMGGGERDTGALAHVLSLSHEVDLISHEAVELGDFATRLNVPLSGVRLRLVPWHPEYRDVIQASADYDLFINTSYLDMFVPRSKRKILRVFFPGRPGRSETGLARRAQLALRRWIDGRPLELLEGFHGPEHHESRPFAWMGARGRFRPARFGSGRPAAIQVVVRGWRPEGAPDAEIELVAEGRSLGRRRLPRESVWTDWRVPIPPELAEVPRPVLELRSTTFRPSAVGLGSDDRELGIAVSAARVVNRLAGSSIADRLQIGTPDFDTYPDLDAGPPWYLARRYDRILSISRFVEEWVQRRWGLPSDVVFPPVDVDSFAPGEKRAWILSVGRFFAGSHNKKHVAMIEAFRGLCDGGLRGWELHLAGGCDLGVPEHAEYLEQVRAAADGYPVTVHVNAPFSELRRLYAESTIFWHATGLGEDENEDPDHFEHFGITTVEAMAAGCVPVVIAKAGQLEIVADGESGLLWRSIPELRRATLRLVNDAALATRLGEGARRRSRDFDLDSFARSVREALEL